mmetsp:Transcript_14675/g.44480  ORF Transcript_14675/g.44480 Transcript_14675/m.44480 type:complete len:290 (+) Transcript_14675:355-1224(+)
MTQRLVRLEPLGRRNLAPRLIRILLPVLPPHRATALRALSRRRRCRIAPAAAAALSTLALAASLALATRTFAGALANAPAFAAALAGTLATALDAATAAAAEGVRGAVGVGRKLLERAAAAAARREREAASAAAHASAHASKRVGAAKELLEDLAGVNIHARAAAEAGAAGAGFALEAGLAKLIVDTPLLVVSEDGVGLRNLPEFCLGLLGLVRVLVGMPLQRKLAVGLLDLLRVGRPRDSKHLVVVCASGPCWGACGALSVNWYNEESEHDHPAHEDVHVHALAKAPP